SRGALRKSFAPFLKITPPAPPNPLAKPLPARSPESAVWHPPPVALPAAPIATTHPSCSVGQGTPSNCPPPPPAESPIRPNAMPRPLQPPLAAIAESRAPHPTSSRLASSRELRPNLPAETRCPRRCRKLPAPAPPEKVAAPFEVAESRPPVPVPCAAAALIPGWGSPSSPTCFSGRNAWTGNGSHGN